MLAVILVVATSLTSLAHGSQMAIDKKNPFVASFNSSVFNIESLFQWPLTITSDPRGYVYTWDPRGGSCSFGGQPETHVGMCQLPHIDNGGVGYACGLATQAFWALDNFQPNAEFTIIYFGGDEWRMTVINFVEDENQENTTITFVSESPYLQYNFEVRGKCVGQPHAQCGKANPRANEWGREKMARRFFADGLDLPMPLSPLHDIRTEYRALLERNRLLEAELAALRNGGGKA